MGVMDWMDGESNEADDTVATDGLGFDELDGEMDDLDGFDDGDDFGGDMDGLEGEMGGFDGGDDLGGVDIDPDTIADMEDRISELENEVSSISSGMNTVREENKQIGETVEELDETIRKLLDIYEMVTRGINPFVDDAREMGGLEGDGAFGLFDMEEETEENLDTDVAAADAESFFDEDFGEIDAEEDEAELAAEDELAEAEREDPSAALEDDADGESADGDATSGSSFDDLKAEYEENEGWEDVGGEALDEEADDEDADDEDTADEDAVEEADAASEERVEIDPDDTLFQPGEESVETNGSAEAAANGTTGTASATPAADTQQSTGVGGEDAYLTALPARYTAESVVLQWTRFLVETGGAIGAARALRQYRSQGWITRSVERTMSEHVRNAATASATERPEDLRVEHHRESLTYISRLAGGGVEESRLLEELSALGGGVSGIRR
ncbi:flagella accessory protein C [Halobellus captivus]|uniref:flagella accessory protein C n=1 Tax=Halobellus captivus TaxID=2592614 RepID=UPI00119FB50F|nr:flagella accessory protein C [Halobellus captivus]